MADDQVSMVDGLTPMERKILFCAFKQPLSEQVSSPLLDFVDCVEWDSGYQYDRKILVKTVIKMCQNFVSLLFPYGFFGTRQKGGKDVPKLCCMTGDQMEKARKEGFLDKFKLITTLSTHDMHLLDANGVSNKYDTPEQIVSDFFSVRLGYYEKRNAVEVEELEEACSTLEMKELFVKEALTGGLEEVLKNKGVAAVCQVLKERGCKPRPPNASNLIEGYQYLLLTPRSIVNRTMMNAWNEQVLEMKDKIQRLKDRQYHSRFLWLRELYALEKALDDVERSERWKLPAGVPDPWKQIIDDDDDDDDNHSLHYSWFDDDNDR